MNKVDERLDEIIQTNNEILESQFVAKKRIALKESIRILEAMKSENRENWKPIYNYFKEDIKVKGVMEEFERKLDKLILNEGGSKDHKRDEF